MRLDARNIAVLNFFLAFLFQNLFNKKFILLKSHIFCLTYPEMVPKVGPKVVKLGVVGFRRS